jgi:anti-sigma factor ChrR (cupin superfamily)
MMLTTMEKEIDLADVAEALSAEPVPPRPELRQRVLDLLGAPALPLDLESYAWEEPLPGIRFCTLEEDAARGVRKVLVWAKPGARYPRHRHLGDEDILVLAGHLRDERATYGPGDICRSETGTDHSEEVLGGEDCICYVVYSGTHEILE